MSNKMKALRNFTLFSSVSLIFIALIISSSHSAAIFAQQEIITKWADSPSSPVNSHTTFVRLQNGHVISVGGFNIQQPVDILRSAEIFNPVTGVWRETAPMIHARVTPQAHLLPDGRLLVIGGFAHREYGQYPSQAYAGPPEIYDPASETWSVVNTNDADLASLYTSFFFVNVPLSLLLPDGRVMIVGGLNDIKSYILDPLSGNIQSCPTVNLPEMFSTTGRQGSLSLLPDGKVLLKLSPVALIFDPDNQNWTETSLPRFNDLDLEGSVQTTLPDGSLFAVLFRTFPVDERQYFGGLFDPSSQQWVKIAPHGGSVNDVISLTDGKVLAITNNGTSKLYDPAQNNWTVTADPPDASQLWKLILLADGRVLSGQQLYGLDFSLSSDPVSAVNVSAASFRVEPMARGSIASVFGDNLSSGNNVSIRIRDRAGNIHAVDRIFATAPNQINYLVPDNLPVGQGEMTITDNNTMTTKRGLLSFVDVSPGLFTANATGRGIPAALALRVRPDGSQSYESLENGIDLSQSEDRIYLILFGTGIRHRTMSDANSVVYIGGARANVLYAGENGAGFEGLDQVNIEIPRNLAGRGDVNLLLTIDGRTANPVTLRIN